MSFFAELKRRNVIRMAGLYGVGAWLIVQVSSTVLPMFDAPTWLPRSIVILLAVGFLPALIFSWVFELTPEGIKRESEIESHESITPQTGRRMDRAIIAVLAVALLYFGFDKFVLAPRREVEILATAHQQDAALAAAKPAADGEKSIAVLPFENLSADKDNAYFSDGITEEILNALAQIPDLKVAARSSAFQFKGNATDLRKVGRVLGVANILEGSVQKDGDQVRINVQLVDARNGLQAWSQKYDRKLTSVFAVEDEISRAIADKLRVQLIGAGGKALVAAGTGNSQAHDLYLRGLALLAARGPGLADAVKVFGEAVALDAQYAQAWGALAETELALPGYVLSVSRNEAVARAESAAQTALRIDPNTVSALVAMGGVYADRLQWPQAQDAYRRAIALAPGDAEAIDQYAQFLFATGQLAPALEQIERAQKLDPLSAIIGVVRTGILMALRRDADATAQLERVLSAHPDFYPANVTAVSLYAGLGRFADAEQQLRTMAAHFDVDANAKAVLARGMADTAQRSTALASLKDAPANADIRTDQVWYATVLAMLDDRDGAIAQLQAFAYQRDAAALGMIWTRPFDPLRSDGRFQAVMKKMGLPYRPANGAGP